MKVMTDERIIAYLLKELPEDDLERFEDECFAAEEWPPEIHLVEEDLIDSYLRDELTPERRQRFERNYLTTDARQERISQAAALLRHLDERNADSPSVVGVAAAPAPGWGERLRAFWSQQTWGLRAASAIVMLVVAVSGLWFFVLRPPAPHTVATLTLSISNTTRGSGDGPQNPSVKLTPDVEALNIALMVPPERPQTASYRVELTDEAEKPHRVEVGESNYQSVQIRVPTAGLRRGQYLLKLIAIKADGAEQRLTGSYLFNVE